jgi:hypothetical protein
MIWAAMIWTMIDRMTERGGDQAVTKLKAMLRPWAWRVIGALRTGIIIWLSDRVGDRRLETLRLSQ